MGAASGRASTARSLSKHRCQLTLSARGAQRWLLTQVLVAKDLDHLPLRQEAIFDTAGHVSLIRRLAQWAEECGAQLQPLENPLAAELLRHDVRHANEPL